MKNKSVLIYVFPCIIFIFVLVLYSLKFICVIPGFYDNNMNFNNEENKEIKELVLDSLKDRHSKLFSYENSDLYTAQFCADRLSIDTQSDSKSVFVLANYDFMKSLEKKDDTVYKVKVQLKYPDDWYYYYTIEVIEGKYYISNFEIDP